MQSLLGGASCPTHTCRTQGSRTPLGRALLQTDWGCRGWAQALSAAMVRGLQGGGRNSVKANRMSVGKPDANRHFEEEKCAHWYKPSPSCTADWQQVLCSDSSVIRAENRWGQTRFPLGTGSHGRFLNTCMTERRSCWWTHSRISIPSPRAIARHWQQEDRQPSRPWCLRACSWLLHNWWVLPRLCCTWSEWQARQVRDLPIVLASGNLHSKGSQAGYPKSQLMVRTSLGLGPRPSAPLLSSCGTSGKLLSLRYSLCSCKWRFNYSYKKYLLSIRYRPSTGIENGGQ